MRLKRTGNYTKAVIVPLMGLAIFGFEAVIIVHVIGQAQRIHAQNLLIMISAAFWLVSIVAPAVLVCAPLRLIRRERKLRAAARDDDARTPQATTQPDTEDALKAGTTITLTRVARKGSLVINILSAVLAMILFALVSQVGLVQFVPLVTTWLTQTIFPVRYLPRPPFPSLLDWLTSAYPLVLSLLLGLVILWRGLANRKYAISANDEGITVRRTLQRPRFIPWNDIDVFLKLPHRDREGFIARYMLHGTSHSVTFFLTGAYWEEAYFVHPAGYVRYVADARALLATIVARSYTPLRLYNKKALTQPPPIFLRAVPTSQSDKPATPTASALSSKEKGG